MGAPPLPSEVRSVARNSSGGPRRHGGWGSRAQILEDAGSEALRLGVLGVFDALSARVTVVVGGAGGAGHTHT